MNMKKEHIDQLISLGEIDNIEAETKNELFDAVSSLEYCNRMTPNFWFKICDDLSISDHLALLKAITLAEKHLNWVGGSVSAVIWVYRAFDDKVDYLTSCQAAKWVVDNSNNDWVPFGSSIKRALFLAISENEYISDSKSLYWSLSQAENCEKNKRAIKEEKRDLVRRKQKKERLKRDQVLREKHEVRKQSLADERKLLIAKGEKLTSIDRLQMVSDETLHPPAFFPIEWADVSSSELSKLSKKSKDKLIEKIKPIKKGSWAILYRALSKLQ